ncbi:MAG: transcriptional repressor [Candidatus Eremiobacteraeota bacterium]|nr:transcriptional repressor [Candidatus Eremiobacteraeota bacterium]
MPEAPSAADLDVDGVCTALARRAYRVTPQRRLIIARFASSRRYITAKDLHARLSRRKPSIGLATVYRTLDALRAVGAACAAPQTRGQTAYLFCATGHHHHAVCTRCGLVDDIPCASIAPFRRTLRRDFRFALARHRLEFFGICAQCS